MPAFLWVVVVLLMLCWLFRHLRNPLYFACSAINAAIDASPCDAQGPPSRRTRSCATHGDVKLYVEITKVQRERERVSVFARALRSLPLRNGGAIRCIRRVNLVEPNVVWRPHGSGKSLLEHHRLLPRLHSVVDDAAAYAFHDSYAAQLQLRVRGNSYAMWQMAEAGAVTLPHVDDDLNFVTMGTYIVVVEGAELIVAWRRDELSEDEVLRALPSLEALHSVPSLTILRAVAGDVIYMPRNTVHMVVTETRKIHLAFHIYENI
jgi:hypothetical protein